MGDTTVTSTPSPSPQMDLWPLPVDKTVKPCFGSSVNLLTTHFTAWKAVTKSLPSSSHQTDTGSVPLAAQPSESGIWNRKILLKNSKSRLPTTRKENQLLHQTASLWLGLLMV